jgi:hypothetical protein
VVVVFFGLLICFSLFYAHLGFWRRVGTSIPVQLMERMVQTIEVWLDNTPPTAPQNLSGGPAPTIERVASYISRTWLTNHAMTPFDSTGGDVLVVCASSHGGVTLTPSDNFNNVWTSLTGPTNSSAGFNLRSQVWYAKNPKVGPNHVFTMTLSAKQALVISMFVVKGSNISDPIDAVSTIADDADTRTLTPTSPRITTRHPNDLLISFGKSATSEVWGAGGGFALQPAASSDYLAAESGLAAAPGSYNSTFVLSRASNWQAGVVAVKPASPFTNTSRITLAWRPSNNNVGVNHYQVERCSGADCENFAQIGTSKDTSFVDSTLPAPGVYRYRVRVLNAAFRVSEYSNTIIAKTGSDR